MRVTTQSLKTIKLAACRVARQARLVRPVEVNFKGQRLPCRVIPLSEQIFYGLGYHPDRFRAGASIGLMERSVFRSFARACGSDAEGGIYPLSANGDNEALQMGGLPYLPGPSRNIVLPLDFFHISLEHEIAHDIFVGGGITAADRQAFFRETLAWYRNAHDPGLPHLQQNRPFYERVAKETRGPFDLAALSVQYSGRRHWLESGFRVFAAECFAYACEAILNPESEMADLLPVQVFSAIRALRIFQLETIRRFQQATWLA